MYINIYIRNLSHDLLVLCVLDPVLKGYVSPAKTPNAAPVTGRQNVIAACIAESFVITNSLVDRHLYCLRVCMVADAFHALKPLVG